MTRSEQYGYLLVNGNALTITQIANFTNGQKYQVTRYLRELEEKGVLSKDENGVIFCRRMIEESQKFEKAAIMSAPEHASDIAPEPASDSATNFRRKQTINANSPIYNKKQNKNKETDISTNVDIPPLNSPMVKPEKSSSKIIRGCRLPEDWQADEECKSYAIGKGLDPDETAEQFCDYWHAKAGKDAIKVNWNATWRTWCRNQVNFRNVHPFPGKKQACQPQKKEHGIQWMVDKARRKQQAQMNVFPYGETLDQWGNVLHG